MKTRAQTPRSPFGTARVASTRANPQSNAKKSPKAIIEPKMVENVPRSRTWNHGALTVTMEMAP